MNTADLKDTNKYNLRHSLAFLSLGLTTMKEQMGEGRLFQLTIK
jgi:hypothetical protein